MKELRARETKALSDEDYELGVYTCTYMYTHTLHLLHWQCELVV